MFSIAKNPNSFPALSYELIIAKFCPAVIPAFYLPEIVCVLLFISTYLTESPVDKVWILKYPPSEVIIDFPISSSFKHWLTNKDNFIGVLQIVLLILVSITGLNIKGTKVVIKVSAVYHKEAISFVELQNDIISHSYIVFCLSKGRFLTLSSFSIFPKFHHLDVS